jgi:hypothetical protein
MRSIGDYVDMGLEVSTAETGAGRVLATVGAVLAGVAAVGAVKVVMGHRDAFNPRPTPEQEQWLVAHGVPRTSYNNEDPGWVQLASTLPEPNAVERHDPRLIEVIEQHPEWNLLPEYSDDDNATPTGRHTDEPVLDVREVCGLYAIEPDGDCYAEYLVEPQKQVWCDPKTNQRVRIVPPYHTVPWQDPMDVVKPTFF